MTVELIKLLEDLREAAAASERALAAVNCIDEQVSSTGFRLPWLLDRQRAQCEGFTAGLALAMKGIQEILDRHKDPRNESA